MTRTLRLRVAGLMLLVVAVLAMALAAGASAATTATIGNTFTGALRCSPAVVVQTTGSAYVVPAGNWNVTSWSTQAGSDGGSMSLMIFRPTATPGTFTVVGESPVQSLTPNTLNTFTLTSPIAVQPGDLLGMWESLADCGVPTGGVIADTLTTTQPPVGATFTPAVSEAGELNISATLSAAMPGTKEDCKQGGWESFGVFKNQGDCVSWVATGGKNPPAG